MASVKPTLGMHLIAGGKDFESDVGVKFLTGLLTSLRPAKFDQFIVIDSGIDPASRQLLKRESALRKRAKLPAIEVYPFTWVNDFAAARNLALEHCTTDWWSWADCDDEIEHAQFLRDYIESADSDTGGYFSPYLYAFDEYGNVITHHDRERLFRSTVGWNWTGRIHEVTIPGHSMTWQKAEEVVWIHHRGLEIKSDRNLPLLIGWNQEEPDNIRVWLFLGNQYFAEGSWAKSAPWYEKVWRDRRASAIDRYAAMTYSARAWRNCEQVQRALIADMAGITEFPQYADSYIGMCENFIHLKEWEKGLAMGRTALTKDPPPTIMFINHLDYTWRLQNDLSICYAGMDQIEEALECAETALKFRPGELEGEHNVKIFRERVQKEIILDALKSTSLDGSAAQVAMALPADLRSEKKARDIWVPNLLKETYRGTQPRISIFCGPSLEDWYADTPSTTGIGGSETAVVEVARGLADMGWKPIVFNSAGIHEGEHDGVTYSYWERFRSENPSDVFVSWRNPTVIHEQPNAPERWLWCHDLHYGDRLTEEIANKYTKVLAVSPWHEQYMKGLYPFLQNTDYVENGVHLENFEGKEPFNRWRFVYASSPDRGLATLLKFWPFIRKMEPMAELHIFYGWESFLKTAELHAPDLYRMHDMIMQMGSQPGVVWRGRVPQKELAREFMAADIWAHPTSFLETFCITAVEAMAANLKIITTAHGNIPYVVGEAGICLRGHAGSIAYGRAFLEIVQGMMQDIEFRQQFDGKGPMLAKTHSWEIALNKWEGLLIPGKVAV